MRKSQNVILRFEFAKQPMTNPGAVVLYQQAGGYVVHYEWLIDGKWARDQGFYSGGTEPEDYEEALNEFQRRFEQRVRWFVPEASVALIERRIPARAEGLDAILRFEFAELRSYLRGSFSFSEQEGRYFAIADEVPVPGGNLTSLSHARAFARWMELVRDVIERFADAAAISSIKNYVEPYPIW